MLKILHLSDLHVGPGFLQVVAEAALKTAFECGADAIVVSGDVTHRAQRGQFEQARQFLNRLPAIPRIVVPGNHDVPLYRIAERFRSPLGLYREYIEDRLNYSVQLPGAKIVALDSTSPRRSISNGRIHLRQLDFCSEEFADVPAGTARIVVAHHHFAPAPDYEWDRVIQQGRRAIDRFADLQVDLILGGHLHRAYIGNTLDVYAGRHRERGMIVVQCGTTTSQRGRGREREKNSLNLVQIDDDQIEITHYIYFHDVDRFEPTSRHTFPRPGTRHG
ncbi:MAG: metallophosphoesterase [Planctomycetaceae bacterium]|nr:metallophosphoesterase [Planctomycetaceae bacterium]